MPTTKEPPVEAGGYMMLHDSLIVVMPTLGVAVARAGESWKRTASADHCEALKPFVQPLGGAASPKSAFAKDPSRSLTPGPGSR